MTSMQRAAAAYDVTRCYYGNVRHWHHSNEAIPHHTFLF